MGVAPTHRLLLSFATGLAYQQTLPLKPMRVCVPTYLLLTRINRGSILSCFVDSTFPLVPTEVVSSCLAIKAVNRRVRILAQVCALTRVRCSCSEPWPSIVDSFLLFAAPATAFA